MLRTLITLIFFLCATDAFAQMLNRAEILEIAKRIESNILSGSTAEVEQEFDKLVTNNVRASTDDPAASNVLNNLFETTSLELESSINSWEKRQPQNFWAKLIKARFYRAYALKARGTQYINETANEALKLYQERLAVSKVALEESLKINPDSTLAAVLWLQLAKEYGFPNSEREKVFQKAVSKDPKYYSAYGAKLEYLKPQWGGSEKELLDFARSNSKANLKFLIVAAHEGLCYQYGGKKAYFSRPEVWSETQNALDQLTKEYPITALFFTKYAELAFLVEKNELAASMLKKAQNLDPERAEVKTLLAKYPWATSGSIPNPNSKQEIDNLMQKASALYDTNKMDDAKNIYLDVTKRFPEHAYAWVMLATIQNNQSDLKGSLESWNKAIEIRPNEASYYTDRCNILMNLNQLQKGIEDCTKAISIDSKEKYAYLNRAKAYQILGKQKEAEQDLKIADSL